MASNLVHRYPRLQSQTSNRYDDQSRRQELIAQLPVLSDERGGLLPPIAEARRIGRLIGMAVGKQAIKDGEALILNEADLNRELQDNIWEPGYVPYERGP